MVQITSSEKQNITSEKERKGLNPRYSLVLVVLAIIFIVIIIKSVNKTNETLMPTTPQAVQYITQTGTPERTIEEKVIQILGEKTNMGGGKIRNITAENDKIFIDFVADENLTTNLTKRGMWTDITDVLKELSPQIDPKTSYITFQVYFTLVDQYGKESVSKVMLITISRKSWEQINWDNFLKENLSKIADSYWEHPALSK